VTNAPKYTHREKYAPHHAGNSYKRLKKKEVIAPTEINKKVKIVKAKAVPVSYPYKSFENGSNCVQ
jgi:hypothetical protein